MAYHAAQAGMRINIPMPACFLRISLDTAESGDIIKDIIHWYYQFTTFWARRARVRHYIYLLHLFIVFIDRRRAVLKYLRQFLFILALSFIGELLHYLIPLPIPASIYGMVLLFAGLMTGWIRIDSVREVGKFLIEIMPVMFIPAGVGLMASWGVLSPILVPACVITVVTIVTVMAATGWSSQLVIRRGRKKQQSGQEVKK